ncbi:MAG: DMT family transporter [Kiloniellales bacterium]
MKTRASESPPAVPGSELLPAGAIAFSALLWGLWWLPLRGITAAGLDMLQLNAALYLSALPVLLPWAWRRRRSLRAGGWALLAAGLLYGLAMIAWNLALVLGEVVRVTLLFYLNPAWGTLFGLLLLGQRMSWLRPLTILLGLFGAAILLGLGAELPLPRSAGDWLGLASGLLFALALTLVRKRPEIEGRDQTIAGFAAAAILSLPAVALTGPLALPASDVLLYAAAAALLWLLPASFLILWGARFVEPGRVGLLLLIEVASAAISATLIAGEPFGLREGMGCLFILGAGGLEAFGALRRQRPARAA